jgi:hypothetical protein
VQVVQVLAAMEQQEQQFQPIRQQIPLAVVAVQTTVLTAVTVVQELFT